MRAAQTGHRCRCTYYVPTSVSVVMTQRGSELGDRRETDRPSLADLADGDGSPCRIAKGSMGSGRGLVCLVVAGERERERVVVMMDVDPAG